MPSQSDGVIRLDVRVRAEHGRGPAGQVAAHRDLLAGRLGVEVDQHHRRLLLGLGDDRGRDLEGAARRLGVDEQPAHQVDDRDGRRRRAPRRPSSPGRDCVAR